MTADRPREQRERLRSLSDALTDDIKARCVLDYWGTPVPVSGQNPYLVRFLEVRGDRFDEHALLSIPPEGVLPLRRPKGPLEWRRELIPEYAWAIPSDAALLCIARYAPLIEIGAGSGYWAHLLRASGVDILAYDRVAGPPGPTGGVTYADTTVPLHHRWTEVLPGGPEQARRHPGRTLLLCWPPLDSPMASRALRLYGGQTVIYIGEWRAATADERFHDLIEQDWEETEDVALPTWWGIHDHLWVYRRQSGARQCR